MSYYFMLDKSVFHKDESRFIKTLTIDGIMFNITNSDFVHKKPFKIQKIQKNNYLEFAEKRNFK